MAINFKPWRTLAVVGLCKKPMGGGIEIHDKRRRIFSFAIYWSPEVGFGWINYRRVIGWNVQLWPQFDAARARDFYGPRKPVGAHGFIKRWNWSGRYK